jgi:signal peptidase
MDGDQPVTVVTAAQTPAVTGLAAAPVAAASHRSAPSNAIVLLNLGLTTLCAVAVAVVLALSIGPRFLAYETFIVRSGSMEPAIGTGALVIVQPVDPRQIEVGDVITYRRPEDPDNTITHRVVDVRAGGTGATAPVFRTRGDANNAVDPWEVQLQGVAWRVTFSVPVAGFLFAFTQQPVGRGLFLILPGLGLGALWLHRTYLRLRRGA